MEHVDTVIVGQGIAGTCLAWQLLWRGRNVRIIERGDRVTTSRVAAGIINPITGQRVALSWQVKDFFAEAVPFYRRTEQELGGTFLTLLRHVRLLKNADEQARFARKREDPAFAEWLSSPQPSPLLDASQFLAQDPGFEMMHGGWLNVAAWLDASAAHFRKLGVYLDGEAPEDSVTWHSDSAQLSLPQPLVARHVVWCTGHAASHSTLFPWLKWRSARGDILTIHAPELTESRMVVRGGWLLPLGRDGLFRTGSTYDWANLRAVPCPEGRAQIESRLHTLLRVPWSTTDHQAGIRPIINESKAIASLHPGRPACGFFNGLGSKGVLHAPRISGQFASALCGKRLPDSDFDL